MGVIEVKSLYKSYGSTVALRGATFSIPKGVIAGLLGPNGSGKTTTLKILVGLLKKDRGEARVFGLDPWENSVEVKERVGILHEKPLFPTDIKVCVLLRHLAKLKGYSESEVKRVARLTGLDRYLDYRVRSLSRGYLQRLGIAQALIGDPELLLLDEPTANLDPLARREILRLIKVLKEDLGVTALISSHIIPELQEVCNYAVFIKNGVVADYGDLEELSRKYSAESVYEVVLEKPRDLASELIKLDIIKGVEVEKEVLRIKVETKYLSEFNDILESLKTTYSIRKVRFTEADLGDIYGKTVSSY